MSANNVGPGGVRNLRAMFENKANDRSNSPPSRGRSPNESVSSSHSRPVSKVRTSFVAVEKPGEQGLSTPPELRKLSDADMDGPDEHKASEGQGLGGILKGSPFVEQGAFEEQPKPQSQPQSESNGVADRAAAMVKKLQQVGSSQPSSASQVAGGAVNGNSVNKSTDRSVKPAQSNQPKSTVETKKPPAEVTKSSAESKNPPPAPRGPVVKPRGGGAKILGVMESAARAKAGRESTARQQESGYNADNTDGSSNQVKEQDPPAAKQVKPKGGVGKIQGVMASAQRAREGRVSSATEAPKEPAASRPPRASLPARKLPTAATAPTTASSAKTSGDSKPSDPKAADKKATPAAPPRVANATTASSLAKKSSRVSLNTNDTSKSKSGTTRPANDSFLARMTKPTASSTQRAHDKVTPQNRPQSRAAATTKKEGTSRPSRKSLGQADVKQGSETDVPDVPAIPESSYTTAVPQQAEQEVTDVESIEPQQAEGISTT